MKVGVLASGGGSNLQSIIDASAAGRIAVNVVLVISNNSKAGALDRARTAGIPVIHASGHTHPYPQALDAAILTALQECAVEYVVLAGYMKKLGPATLAAYRNRVLNIHPALLPDFGGQGMYGMNVHRAVVASGATESGPTVHLVNAEYDEGPILAQQPVPVFPEDAAETLQARVLEAEHVIYPYTLSSLAGGIIAIHDSPLEVIIRPLALNRDFAEAADTVRLAFAAPAAEFGLTRENCPAHPSFTQADRLLKIRDTGGTFFGAFHADRMIGCVAVEPSREEKRTWYIEKLAVSPERQGSGLGTILVQHACNAIIRFGGNRVTIGIIDDDAALKAWYERRGFDQTGTRVFAHLPFTVCFMERLL